MSRVSRFFSESQCILTRTEIDCIITCIIIKNEFDLGCIVACCCRTTVQCRREVLVDCFIMSIIASHKRKWLWKQERFYMSVPTGTIRLMKQLGLVAVES